MIKNPLYDSIDKCIYCNNKIQYSINEVYNPSRCLNCNVMFFGSEQSIRFISGESSLHYDFIVVPPVINDGKFFLSFKYNIHSFIRTILVSDEKIEMNPTIAKNLIKKYSDLEILR